MYVRTLSNLVMVSTVVKYLELGGHSNDSYLNLSIWTSVLLHTTQREMFYKQPKVLIITRPIYIYVYWICNYSTYRSQNVWFSPSLACQRGWCQREYLKWCPPIHVNATPFCCGVFSCTCKLRVHCDWGVIKRTIAIVVGEAFLQHINMLDNRGNMAFPLAHNCS